jgi:hypothetical protein
MCSADEDQDCVNIEEAFYNYLHEFLQIEEIPNDKTEDEIALQISLKDLKEMFIYASIVGGNSGESCEDEDCDCEEEEDDNIKCWEMRIK